MTIGVLALQGDYEAHEKVLARVLANRDDCETRVVQVKTAGDLAPCDALILPGGESTAMSRLCDRNGLWEPLQEKLRGGMSALGTCAGLILLAKNLEGATRNFAQKTLGVLDVDVQRNAYGAQLDSFSTDIELLPREYSQGESDAERDVKTSREYSQSENETRDESSSGETMRGVFIRAPRIIRCGDGVEILARYEGAPVAVRQGNIIAAAFHPEVCGETRLHELWLDSIADCKLRIAD